jgi:hypothetical protein
MRKNLLIPALVAALSAPLSVSMTGCVGSILGSDDGGGGGGDDIIPPDEPREVCASGEADLPGPRLLRRMTLPEFTANVLAGFTLTASEWRGGFLPPDPAGKNGFTNNVDRLRVSEGYAKDLYDTAKDVAEAVTVDAVVRRILPCASTGGAACANTFLDTFGKRLYRRPLSAAEKARYIALFDKVASDGGLFTDWMYWATVGLVQSPHSLYRSELGDSDGGTYRLTGYELATALAFNLTGKPPTDALLTRAGNGDLDDAAGVAAAARELVLDGDEVRADFRAVFLQFVNQWFGISTLGNLQKSPDSFPGFTEAVRNSMLREVNAFVSHVVFDEKGGVSELLTSPTTFLDRDLSAFYGFGDGNAATPTERPEGWGVGVLAQGAILSVYAGNEDTSPVRRGVLVQKKFLCFEPPPPPAVVGDLPVPTGNETTRQRYELHSTNPDCRGCHQYMDPVGFAFEHLDAAGRFRPDENGLPIDDTGNLLIASTGDSFPFSGPTELATAIAARPETAECVASYVASYAYGLDNHDVGCLVSSLTDELRDDGLGFVDFYIKLAQTNHFTRRVD